MHTNPYSIPPLICSFFIFSFGLYVLLKCPKSPPNRAFFLLCLSTTTWLSLYALNFTISYINENLGVLLYKIGYCGVAFIGITFFHFFAVFYDDPHLKKAIKINYIFGVLICVLIFKTNLLVSGLIPYFWGLYPKAGPAHPIFLVYFLSLCVVANYLSFKTLFSPTSSFQIKNQAKYIFISFSIFTFACLDFLPNYGIEIYPAGYIYATLFIIIVGYAAIKHNLLEVNIVIQKGLIYSLLIALITIIYLISVLLFERIFQGFFGYRNSASTGTALLIALIFIPLKDKIQKFIDKIFLKGSPIEIAKENEYLRKEVAQAERFKSIALLASGIAHEIKNPLTPIRTFLEYLPQKSNDKEFIKKFGGIARSSVDRIDELINELLKFAKPAPLQLNETDINKLITSTLELLSSEFLKHNIRVNKNFIDKFSLNVDQNQIRQALLNVFLNAIDAMPNGGTLTVKTANIRKNREKMYQILVQDTGEGIAKEDLSHIFDPFFTKKDKGTGLGLSITNGIIMEHGGKIHAESKAGEGATFIIELPITTA